MRPKKKYARKICEEFRQAIDEAPKPVPPAGSRYLPIKRAVWKVLASIIKASDADEPSNIINDYLLDEKERIRKVESEGQEADTENHAD